MYPEVQFIREAKKRKWKYRLKWSNEWIALCDYKGKKISLSLLRAIVTCIIHENLHLAHPKWTEKQVIRAETARRQALSKKEALAILKEAFPLVYTALRRFV